MPRRSILSSTERDSLLALPEAKDELIRHYTLSKTDLSIIGQHRESANRLGFAVQLCYLRFPGIVLGVDEPPFPPLLRMVAAQLKVPLESWDEYGQREQTRREHLVELQTMFGFNSFTMSHYRREVHTLTELALQTDKGIVLASALVENFRRQSVIVPVINAIERLNAWQALHLPTGIERLVHQNRLLKIAREGGQMTPSDLARFEVQRRYATLVALAIDGMATVTVTDEIIELHDRIIGKLFNAAKNKHQQQLQASGKAINDKVRLYGRVGQALLEAKKSGADPFAAIKSVLSWDAFAASVGEAQKLAQPAQFDFLHRIGESYATLRRYGGMRCSGTENSFKPRRHKEFKKTTDIQYEECVSGFMQIALLGFSQLDPDWPG